MLVDQAFSKCFGITPGIHPDGSGCVPNAQPRARCSANRRAAVSKAFWIDASTPARAGLLPAGIVIVFGSWCSRKQVVCRGLTQVGWHRFTPLCSELKISLLQVDGSFGTGTGQAFRQNRRMRIFRPRRSSRLFDPFFVEPAAIFARRYCRTGSGSTPMRA